MRVPMQVINGYGPMGYGSSLEGLGTTTTLDFGFASVPIDLDPYETEVERQAAINSVLIDQINAANASNPSAPLLGPTGQPVNSTAIASAPRTQQQQVGAVSNTTALLFLAAAVGVLFLVR